LFYLQCYSGRSVDSESAFASESITRWHERLCHNNKEDVVKLQTLVTGMAVTSGDTGKCNSCLTEKAKRAPIRKGQKVSRAEKPLDVVHSDVLGPMQTVSSDGYRYVVSFVDSFSRFVAVYFLKTKSATLDKVRQFVADYGTPRVLVTDNGGEYASKEAAEFYATRGIRKEWTSPYTPEENGKAERLWSTLTDMTRCILKRAHMSNSFWVRGIATSAYTKNRCRHASIEQGTPYEAFYGKKPDVSNLRVFGCKAYVYVQKEFRKKLDSRARCGVFVGYDECSQGYLVLLPQDGGGFTKVRARSVTFDETAFFF
jgi:transposase InsO family protein